MNRMQGWPCFRQSHLGRAGLRFFRLLRQNRFSSPINILLSFVSVWIVWQILSVPVPRIWFSVGDAGSLTECRAIMDQRLEEGVRSACFAVINDRWYQLVFGSYPRSESWRPPLALIIFFAAIAPVLFSRLPQRLLWFSVASPFVIFTLLWGGPIWMPFSAASGCIAGWLVFRFLSRMNVSSLSSVGAFAVAIAFWVFVGPFLAGTLDAVLPIGLLPVSSKDFGGFTSSIVTGLCSIMLSLPPGTLLALGRQSELFIISKLSVVFVEVIRGVPMIVWLFAARLLLNYFLPRGTNFDLMLCVIIMVSLFSAAYLAEVIGGGGLAAIPKGQYEAAYSLGLDCWRAMRLVVLPQASKMSIPGIVNTFIGLYQGYQIGRVHRAVRSDRTCRIDACRNGLERCLPGELCLHRTCVLCLLFRAVTVFDGFGAQASPRPQMIRQEPS